MYDSQLQTGVQRGAQDIGAPHFFGWRPNRKQIFALGQEGLQPSRLEFSVWIYQPGTEEQKKKKERGLLGDPVLDEPDLLKVAQMIAPMGVLQVCFVCSFLFT